jgi:chorismate mutase
MELVMRGEILKTWGFDSERVFLVAGPCSAESEGQVQDTARALSGAGIDLFRAGIWKPRTRPGSFEGVGVPGLDWMVKARAETGLKIATEVAEPAHVEACLERSFDVLWIGARTTTNPFSVQAIADALQGTDIPVFVKNPMNADAGLWMGAIERLANAGVKKIGAIHRGVGSSLETKYRNAPAWKLPIELMRKLPEVPVLCDPSHICGRRELIPAIAQEAMDLLFDGLMIEVHPEPEKALSDAAQQLTPADFISLIHQLVLTTEEGEGNSFAAQLHELREDVDDIDGQILTLLGKRMEVVRAMGRLKSEHKASTLQPHRWEEMLSKRIEQAGTFDLSEEFAVQLMQSIHEEAIRQQEDDRLGQ